MIIAGADVIGNAKISEHEFIGLVVGTDEAVNKLHNDIGLPEIHMRDLTTNQKNKVYQNIHFTDHDIEAWCLHVERQSIVNSIKINVRLDPKHKRSDAVQKHFDKLLLKKIREPFENFTIPKGKHIEDLTMQCDGDMTLTAQNWHMGTRRKGKAFELADAVVYFNKHRQDVDGCHDKDLRDDLMNGMEHDLLK